MESLCEVVAQTNEFLYQRRQNCQVREEAQVTPRKLRVRTKNGFKSTNGIESGEGGDIFTLYAKVRGAKENIVGEKFRKLTIVGFRVREG